MLSEDLKMESEIVLTQGKVAIIDDEDFGRLSDNKWHAAKNRNIWYARTSISGRIVPMHRLILNYSGEYPIDHINGDGLDNRKSNIRICSHSENQRNRHVFRNKSSSYRGVYLQKKCGNWIAMITVMGTRKYLGSFDSEEAAYNAYLLAASKYFRELPHALKTEVK
jgi:hypothetical protein